MTIPVRTIQHFYLDSFGEEDVFQVTQFPGGEFHPNVIGWKATSASEVVIHTRLKDGDDVMKLLTVTDAFKRYGIKDIFLYVPYFPGLQQDRVANPGEALTCKIYADLINSQNYAKVFIIDPHNGEVAQNIINNCVILDLNNVLKQVLQNYDTILVPDAGASKKIYSYYLKGIDWKGDIVQCLKERDTKTGELSGFQCIAEYNQIKNKRCIILDDISVAGGTFLGLADEVLKHEPETLGLYVTHGIFSKGFKLLFDKFDYIYTTNSWESKESYKRHFIERPADFFIPEIMNSNFRRLKVIGIH